MIHAQNYAASQLLYNALMRESLSNAIRLLNVEEERNITVLDAGCGPGGTIPILCREIDGLDRVVAVDASLAHLEIAKNRLVDLREKYSIEFHQLDLAKPLPFSPQAFDLIWIADVIFPDIFSSATDLVKSLARYLKPKGKLAIFYGNWLRSLFLPGYAQLEHQICAAKEIMYSQSETWHGLSHPESVLAWLNTAGLVNCQMDVLNSVHVQPLEPEVKEYIAKYVFGLSYAQAISEYGSEVGLNEKDIALWDALTNPESDTNILENSNYFCLMSAIFAFGEKAQSSFDPD